MQNLGKCRKIFHRFLYISHFLWELLLCSHLLDVSNVNSFTDSSPKLQCSPASQQKGALMEYKMLSSCRSFTWCMEITGTVGP